MKHLSQILIALVLVVGLTGCNLMEAYRQVIFSDVWKQERAERKAAGTT
jgi:uncharacterized lipoprotein YehR (DUF1307 family)